MIHTISNSKLTFVYTLPSPPQVVPVVNMYVYVYACSRGLLQYVQLSAIVSVCRCASTVLQCTARNDCV
jgi:hypothetical protein